MDWDWLLPFTELCNNTGKSSKENKISGSIYWDPYYSANSEQIIGGALTAMENSSNFHWNIAEMAFLKDFKENLPEAWNRLLQGT